MTKGMIYDIKEFSIFDGPGIRKTVFFKGCPLRCIWCHNPEGISFEQHIIVSKGLCTHCGQCHRVCGKDVCDACGDCIPVCPQHIRRICGREYTAEDLAKELKKGKDVLENSHGGITLSGGEPTAQPEFLLELIHRLKPMHIVLDTCGHTKEQVFQEVIQQVDLVLFDVKHTDATVHRRVTGVDNALILKNLDDLCDSGKAFIIRIPLIPGINDTRENMERTAELLKDAKGLQRVELLPYNKAAGAKYAMIGKTYAPDFDVSRKPNVITEPFTRHGIRSVVL